MATPRMIDIAVNFTDGMFKGLYHGKQCHKPDIAAVLSRAWSAGVDRIIVTGGSLEESKEALAIAETDVFYSWQQGFSVPLVCTQQGAKNLTRVGIQKSIFRNFCCWLKRVQRKGRYFEKLFELAYLTKLPMFLHMRAAAEDFCDILERNKDRFSAGVVHSFTGSAEDCNKVLSFSNLFIGINGCSLKTPENLEVVKCIPVERMMIETDSPYCEIKNTHAGVHFVKSLWPSKKKEKYDRDCIVKGRNEPCLVRQVLEVVAGCRGIADMDQLSKTLYHNTCRVFFPHDLDSAADAILSGGHGTE